MAEDFTQIRSKRSYIPKLEFIKRYRNARSMTQANEQLIDAELRRIKRNSPETVFPF